MCRCCGGGIRAGGPNLAGVTPLLLRPDRVAAGGDAIARDETGRVVFVEGAIPGETVEAEVIKSKKDYGRARIVEVSEPSPDRVEPPCPHVEQGCGGCQWQHISVTRQLDLKTEIVADAMRRQGRIPDPPISRSDAVAAAGYRTTARLAVVGGRAAYHRRHAQDLIAVDSCLIAHPGLEDLIVNGRWGADATEVLLRVSGSSRDRIAVVQPRADGASAPDDVKVLGENHIQGGRRAVITERVAGRRWQVSHTSFFQTGPLAAELLVEAVRRAAGSPRAQSVVVDAYAGVGLLGWAVAEPAGARVIAVETNKGAAADARRNLKDIEAEVREREVSSFATDEPVDVVIADPARTGLGPSAAAALAAIASPVLVLVSCDPASLGRDAVLLSGHGYHLEDVQILDLFPHTTHVEAVSRWVLPGSGAGR